MSEYRMDTQCIHAGYHPGNGEPRVMPIVQSTTFRYETSEAMGRLFDLEDPGFFYTRLGNPTLDAVEQKIAALEGRRRCDADFFRSGRIHDRCPEYLPCGQPCCQFQRYLRRHLQFVLQDTSRNGH